MTPTAIAISLSAYFVFCNYVGVSTYYYFLPPILLVVSILFDRFVDGVV